MRVLPIILLSLLCLASCRTQQKNVSEYVYIHDTDTIREVRWQLDSIFIKEKEQTFSRGDTIFVIKEIVKYKEKNRTDTIREIKTLTITKKLYYTKTKEVNRLYWWQKALMWIGAIASGGGAVWFVIKLKR